MDYDMNRDDSNDPKTDWTDIFWKVFLLVCGFLFLIRVIFSIELPDTPVFNYIDTTPAIPVGIVAIILFVIYLGKKARN